LRYCHDVRPSVHLSIHLELVLVIVTLLMTAQTMSIRYKLANKGFSAEKAQHHMT